MNVNAFDMITLTIRLISIVLINNFIANRNTSEIIKVSVLSDYGS